MAETLTKHERLCQERLIRNLFREGISLNGFPLRCKYLLVKSPGAHAVQVLFAVPKSLFPRAVDRNTLKRRMREAYRLHKTLLPESRHPDQPLLVISFLYLATRVHSFDMIRPKIILLLQRLSEEREKAGR